MNSNEPLCFCEYINVRGERSHMIATCCDCEAVDTSCDRFCRCQGLPDDLYESLLLLLQDRIRLPWCSGRGAKQCDWQIVGPIVLLSLMFAVGSLHPLLTVMSLSAFAFCIVKHHRVWMRKERKPKTKVFYVFGVSSAWILFITFLVIILPLGKISFIQFTLFVILFSLMMWTLFHARKDPGFLCTNFQTNSSQGSVTFKDASGKDCSNLIGSIDGSSNIKDGAENTHTEEDISDHLTSSGNNLRSIPLKEVNWVDSRPIKDDVLVVWCDKCEGPIPIRGAHCPVCEVCVAGRDHHCVWIDQCIGEKNHRSFILLMAIWVLCGLYGSHLALESLCSSHRSHLLQWSNIPSHCSGVYNQYSTAMAFVGVCFTVICCLVISLVLFNQIILVAQNLTSQELHNALKLGWVRFLCFAKNNRHNRGFVRNVLFFFSNLRQKRKVTLAV